jgi:hypothetical protein
MNEKPKKENVFKWCTIRAVCDSFEMDFPMFLMIAFHLVRGDKYLGFCQCNVCSQGYRQPLAWLAISKGNENKKLTAQSRDVVIRARNTEINGLSFDISNFISKVKENEEKIVKSEDNPPRQQPVNCGKIVIEIGSEALENAVCMVLKSEKGREIIQSVPRKYTKKNKKI